jgi:hypothetical protein
LTGSGSHFPAGTDSPRIPGSSTRQRVFAAMVGFLLLSQESCAGVGHVVVANVRRIVVGLDAWPGGETTPRAQSFD